MWPDNYVNQIVSGDAISLLAELPDKIVQTCVTSPPYFGLRDYGVCGQIGLESSPDIFVSRLVDVFKELRRVMRDDGVLWVVISDSYARAGGTDKRASASAKVGNTRNTLSQITSRKQKPPHGMKDKDMIGIPWMLAFALRGDGWYLRQDIIWQKANAMPESVKDRCTRSHEYVFMLSKSKRYYFDVDAIKEPSADGAAIRNKRSIWSVNTAPYKGAHFATFPEALVEPCILSSSRPGDMVIDPFIGSGTTAAAAKRLGRNYIGFDLNEQYTEMAKRRINHS